jgi:RNA polymerase sigma factor (sigma-70 family)
LVGTISERQKLFRNVKLYFETSKAMSKHREQSSLPEIELMSSIPNLRRFVASKVKNPADRDDIIQESLCRVIKSSQVKDITNPLAYTLMVAKSAIIDHWREEIKSLPQGVDNADGQSEFSVEQKALNQAHLMAIVALVNAMPPLRKKVFFLRRLEGLSREQIARQLNISEASVKKHMTRALMDLTEGLKKAGWNQ